MNKKDLIPHQSQPITRITTGQLPTELLELSEELLQEEEGIVPSGIYTFADGTRMFIGCSYDSDDEA